MALRETGGPELVKGEKTDWALGGCGDKAGDSGVEGREGLRGAQRQYLPGMGKAMGSSQHIFIYFSSFISL